MRMDLGTTGRCHDSGKHLPILCRIAGHSRSSQLAYNDGHGAWQSRCKRCGQPMIRLRHKRWIAVVIPPAA